MTTAGQARALELLAQITPGGFPVYCPVPLRENSRTAEDIDGFGTRWAIEHGICSVGDSYTQIKLGGLVRFGGPFLPDEAFETLMCWFAWGFLYDDHLDSFQDANERVVHVSELTRVLHDCELAAVPDTPWTASLRDVIERMRRCTSQAGMAHFRTECSVWLMGELWKFALLDREQPPPSSAEYLRMRPYKGGLTTISALTMDGTGRGGAVDALADPKVRALSQAVSHACTLINDLVSFAKELITGQGEANLVMILARERRIGTMEAVVEVARLYERIVCFTIRILSELDNDPRPGVSEYARAWVQWIPATVHWSPGSSRYTDLGHLLGLEGTKASSLSLVAQRTPSYWDQADMTPPPYQDIAWWWDQLD